MCRFYSMSYQDVMAMPLRSFWSFNANVIRLRAEENLQAIDLQMVGAFGASSEMVDALRKSYSEAMKSPIKATGLKPPAPSEEEHKEGIAKLRALAGRLKPVAPTPHVDPQPQS